MHRIPEPELMDTPEQAQAYALADFSEPHEAFVACFREKFPDFKQGAVLDLGCGTADVTIRFGRAYPEATLLGVEGAAAMLELGMHAVRDSGMTERICLEQHYLPAAALDEEKGDAVISNSLLHHLDDPMTLWQTVKQVAKPGAPVLVMDLMRPASVVEAMQLIRKYAADAPLLLQNDYYHSLLASYRIQEVKRQLFKADLDCFQVEASSDRHIVIWGKIDV